MTVTSQNKFVIVIGLFGFHFCLQLCRSSFHWIISKESFRRKRKRSDSSKSASDSFPFCFRLLQSGIHWIISHRVISGIERKWRCSDSSESDSVEILTSPILRLRFLIFNRSGSALMTPLTTMTPLLVKPRLAFNKPLSVTMIYVGFLSGS